MTAVQCAHVAAAGAVCRCGHGAELHALATDNTTRKRCSVSTGPKATPCGCERFDPQEVS